MANAVYDDQDTNLDELEKAFHAPSAETSGSDIARQREVDSLNNQFNHSPDEATETKKPLKSDDAETLKDKEETPDDTVGEGYTGDGKGSKKRRWMTRKRATGIGAVISLITALGIATPGAGVLEFLHFAESIRLPHMGAQENAGNARLGALFRAWRSGNVGDTRLGYISYKYKNRMIADMKRAGFEPVFDKKTGYFKGVNIDTKSEGSPYKDMSTEEAKAKVTEKFGTKTYQIVDGKLRVQAKNFLTQRRALNAISREMGYNRVTTAGRTRVLSRYGVVSFHPIVALDKKLNTKISAQYDKWRKARQEKMKSGVKPATMNDTGAKLETKDPKGNPTTTDIGGTTNGELEPSKVKKVLGQIKASKSLKITGGVAAAVGIVCGAKAVADNLDDIKYAQVIKPLTRQGMDIIATADQIIVEVIRNGRAGTDVDLRTLDFLAKSLRGKDSTGKVTDWSQAAPIVANNGGTGGVDFDTDTKKLITENAVPSWLIWTQNAAMNGVCSGIGSIVTGVLSIGVGVISGGILSTAVGFVVSDALAGPVIGKLTSLLTSGAIDYAPVGAQLGLQADHGALLGANMQGLQFGGRILHKAEVFALQQEVRQDEIDTFNKKSIAYRMFNPIDRNSLVAKVIDDSPNSTTTLTTNIARAVPNALNAPMGFLKTLSVRKTYAASSTYDYGLPVVGFSADELENPAVADPFANADKAAQVLAGSDGQKYIDLAKECFGVGLIKGSEGWDVTPAEDVAQTLYSTKNPRKSDCDKTNDQTWLSIRFFIMDTATMEGWSCLQGDETACTNNGVGGRTGSGSEDSTTGGTLQPVTGTEKELAQKIIASGKVSADSRYMGQIKAYASGDYSCHINPDILKLIATIAQSYTITISSLNRRCTGVTVGAGTGSYHYRDGGGHAVDISVINGIASTGGAANDLKLLNNIVGTLPTGSGIGQIGCRPSGAVKLPTGISEFPDSCNHVHIQVPIK